MKKLLKYTVYLLICLTIAAYGLEVLFSYYAYHGTLRNKIKWVKSLEENPSYDYILLGSSRTLNFLQPKLIDSLTGLKGINLGINASGPIELKLMLKEYLKKGAPSYVFVQTDYRTSEAPDPLGSVPWIPYITQDETYEVFKPYGRQYEYYHYLPYYRYAKFGAQIGTREILLTLVGHENHASDFMGYQPIYTIMQEENKHSSSRLEKSPNKHLVEIESICREFGLEVYFFTVPIYNSPFDFSFYQGFLSNYTDFSNLYQDKQLFSNVTHLNHQGAVLFTKHFTKYYFKN